MAKTHVSCEVAGCNGKVDRDKSHCDLAGHLNDAPNVRFADSQSTDLRKMASGIRACFEVDPNTRQKLTKLLEAVKESTVAFSIKPKHLLSWIERNGDYSNYYKLRRISLVENWTEELARERGQADEWMFPGFKSKISFGYLIPGDDCKCEVDGITSYGECTVYLSKDIYKRRTSLFIGDLLHYYRSNRPDSPAAKAPVGTTAKWLDLENLAIVKVQPSLNKSVNNKNLIKLVFAPNASKKSQNDFIEAHIFDSISTNAIIGIRLSKKLTNSMDTEYWKTIKAAMDSFKIVVSEKSGTKVV